MSIIPKEKIDEVKKYITKSMSKSDEEREDKDSEKSGVFTGLYCVNSITNKRLPIWVADFVLSTVGSGAVVGVPAHDERDFQFAQKYGLPVIRVIEGENGDRSPIDTLDKVYTGEGIVFNSGFLDGLSTQEARVKVGEFIKEKEIGDMVVGIIFMIGYFLDSITGVNQFQSSIVLNAEWFLFLKVNFLLNCLR